MDAPLDDCKVKVRESFVTPLALTDDAPVDMTICAGRGATTENCMEFVADRKFAFPESVKVRVHVPTLINPMVLLVPDAVQTPGVLLLTVTGSSDVAVAVTVTLVPDWGLVGTADNVMVLAPLPTLNAVDVALTVRSVALRVSVPAFEGTIFVKYAIPDVFVGTLKVLVLESVPGLNAVNVTVSPEIGNPLPPRICTSAVVATFTLVGEGSSIKDADAGVIPTISTVGLPHFDEFTVSP